MLQSHWLDILLSVGFAQGAFVSVVLWQKKPSNHKAVFYLVLLIMFLSTVMLLRASYQPAFLQQFAEVILLPDVILFLIGPCLYFFTLCLLQMPHPQPPFCLWHYFPAAFHVLVINTVVGLHLNGTFSFLETRYIYWIFYAVEGAAITSLSAYLWLSYRHYRGYRGAWQQRFENPFPAALLRPFFMVGFFLASFWAASYLHNLLQAVPDYSIYYALWYVLVGYVFYLGYQILLRPDLLGLPRLKTTLDIPAAVLEKIEQHMGKAQPHLNPALKIGDLADALDMPKHELSKVLNHAFGKNFFDYLNAHRIKTFIALRNDARNDHLNISDLSFQSGFNSRTAFNRAFRKETGLTPSEYFSRQQQPNVKGL